MKCLPPLLLLLVCAGLLPGLTVMRAERAFLLEKRVRSGSLPPVAGTLTAMDGIITEEWTPFAARLLKKGMELPRSGELVVLEGGTLLLDSGTSRQLMAGPLRARLGGGGIVPDEGIILEGGASLETVPAGLYRLTVSPPYPAPGGIMVFRLAVPGLGTPPELSLPGKLHAYFYPERDRETWIARTGIDCQESGREQSWTIRFRTGSGLAVILAGSRLLHDYRDGRSDIRKQYIRLPLPSVIPARQPALSGHPLLPTRDDALFRETSGTHRGSGKKDGPPLTRFTPTIQLPPEKRLLYSRKEDIAEESRIHHRSMAQSISRQLWEGPFLYPAHHRFSSIFGEVRFWSQWSAWAHRGIDIAAFMGEPVLAPNNGHVRFSGHTVLCGKTVILDHGQFVISKIFHMLRLDVREGEYVKKGQVLGLTGSTGISTGPHIHWELWVGSTKVDPNLWVLGERADHIPPLLDRKGRKLYRFLAPPR